MHRGRLGGARLELEVNQPDFEFIAAHSKPSNTASRGEDIYILEELDDVDENGGYNERTMPSSSELSLTSLSHEGEPRR